MSQLPITRVVLYKHGVGHFEREGQVEDSPLLSLTFKNSSIGIGSVVLSHSFSSIMCSSWSLFWAAKPSLF